MADFAKRQIIRETWKNDCETSNFCSCIFVIGRSTNNDDATRRLEEEASTRQDIVQMDIADTYHNLTLKTMFSIQWDLGIHWATFQLLDIANSLRFFLGLPQHYQYLVKADDDVFLNIPLLYDAITKEENPTDFVLGDIVHRSQVKRQGLHGMIFCRRKILMSSKYLE